MIYPPPRVYNIARRGPVESVTVAIHSPRPKLAAAWERWHAGTGAELRFVDEVAQRLDQTAISLSVRS